jgi:cytochrome c6
MKSNGKWIAGSLLLAGLLVQAGLSAAPKKPAAKKGVTASGSAIYSKNCASTACHGPKGTSPSGWRAKVKGMSGEAVETAIRKGASGMPAFGAKLKANEVQAVAAYTKKLVAK